MAKCSVCRSCFRVLWFETKVYYYCSLCQKVYKPVDNKLVPEEDPRIISGIKQMAGTAI